MNKEMIISSTSHETRVAILEDDQVVEIFIEREHSRGVVGNVYKGRVSKVLPGMQSAFVDLGLERDAFLYVTDVISPTEEALEDDEDTPAVGAEPPESSRLANGTDVTERLTDDDREAAARPRRRGAGPPGRAPGAPGAPGAPRPRPHAAHRQDRRPAEGRAGGRRPGRQGAARHQGRAHHVAPEPARTVPGLHADRRSHRHFPQNRLARRAAAPPRHRPALPRAVGPARRGHHPHGGVQPVRGRPRSPT